MTCEEKMPNPTFGTIEELHFAESHVENPPITQERGSACCAPLQDPNGMEPLLGISHSKTRFKNYETRDNIQGGVAANVYFSTFYAMEITSPDRVVARSGKFCLGFPD